MARPKNCLECKKPNHDKISTYFCEKCLTTVDYLIKTYEIKRRG